MKRVVLPIAIVLALAAAWVLLIHPRTPSVAGGSALSRAEVQRILDAPAKYTYVGTGITKSWYDGRPISSDVKVFHKAPNKHRIEFLSPPLKGLTAVNDGKCFWRFDPKLHSIVGSQGEYSSHKDRLALLLTNYRARETGSTHIAGRTARIVEVRTPSGELRKRLWVDDKTCIILASENCASDGKLLSKTALATIDYDAAVPDSLYAKPSGKGEITCFKGGGQAMSYDQLSKALGYRVMVPGYVPSGFKLDAYRLFKCPCMCDHRSAYTRYTNGMGSISIFETSADSHCLKQGGCNMRDGGCSMHDQTAVVTSHGRSFIVIGDASPQDLKKITESLK